ncbi:MAG: selenoprotein O and cysteine like protein, partial [Gammaproteobacteria bacterium]|nr:selenoprotein O and cysteine like protein [Gammaproteobacteria bacterium]
MLVGFIHGVMNTDNVSIVGETIDYGPCAFMDEFRSNKVFSSIDQTGRYAWDQQPAVAYWNLTQFAQCLLPILHTRTENAKSMAEEQLEAFIPLFQNAFQEGLRQKFGLTKDDEASASLIEDGFNIMGASKADFTVFFDGLTRVAGGEADTLVTEIFEHAPGLVDWLTRWRDLKSDELDVTESMRQANPAVIPRNHRVAQAIDAAVNDHNYEPFRQLHRVLANPYQLNELDHEFRNPPEPQELVTQTFCGT